MKIKYEENTYEYKGNNYELVWDLADKGLVGEVYEDEKGEEYILYSKIINIDAEDGSEIAEWSEIVFAKKKD